VPGAHACRRAWHIRGNWTDMMFPWPFTEIYARGGPPLFVPPDLGREELERYAERLEGEMERLEKLVAEAAKGAAKGPRSLKLTAKTPAADGEAQVAA